MNGYYLPAPSLPQPRIQFKSQRQSQPQQPPSQPNQPSQPSKPNPPNPPNKLISDVNKWTPKELYLRSCLGEPEPDKSIITWYNPSSRPYLNRVDYNSLSDQIFIWISLKLYTYQIERLLNLGVYLYDSQTQELIIKGKNLAEAEALACLATLYSIGKLTYFQIYTKDLVKNYINASRRSNYRKKFKLCLTNNLQM